MTLSKKTKEWVCFWILGLELFLITIDLHILGEVVAAFSAVTIAFFAYKGFDDWKRQKHTDIKLKLLDDLSNTVHEFYEKLMEQIHSIEFIEIGIQCHKDTLDTRGLKEKNITPAHFIVYLKQEHTKQDGRKLLNSLTTLHPLSSRLKLLTIKIQSLELTAWNDIYNSNTNLIHISNRMAYIASMLINGDSLFVENPDVQKHLKKVLEVINSNALKKDLNENLDEILKVIQDNYKLLFN